MVTHDDPKYKVNPTKVFHAGKVFVPKPNGKIGEWVELIA